MKPLFIVSTLGALFLAVIYLSEWLSTFLIIGGIFVIAVGLAILVTAHLSLVTRSTSSIIYTKPTPELEAMHKYLTVSTIVMSGRVYSTGVYLFIPPPKCVICYFAHHTHPFIY